MKAKKILEALLRFSVSEFQPLQVDSRVSRIPLRPRLSRSLVRPQSADLKKAIYCAQGKNCSTPKRVSGQDARRTRREPKV